MKNTILKKMQKETLQLFKLLAAVVFIFAAANLAAAQAYKPFSYMPETSISSDQTAGTAGTTGGLAPRTTINQARIHT